MTETVKISLTGHRPNKLKGKYDYYHPANLAIATKLREHLLAHLNEGKRVHAISGMALGADTIFALVALKLKKQGYDVLLEAAIPCANHSNKWPDPSKKQWRAIVDAADIVTYVSKQTYRPYLMQKRNEYMVDHSHKLIAVWDKTPGGTANCVNYAKGKNKEIIYVNPNQLVIQLKGDLLASDCDVVMHQANARSTMGSGIAQLVKAKFPEAYAADCSLGLSPEDRMGKYTSAQVINNNKTIEVVNLYGQLYYGKEKKRYTDYQALGNAIYSYLNDRKQRGDLDSIKIGVPKNMGCARAGGDWTVVTQILESACRDFNISIYTYAYNPDQKNVAKSA